MNYKILILALFLTSCASVSATPQGTPAQVMASGASSTPAMAYPATPDISALQDDLYNANQKLIDAQNIVSAKQAEIDRMDRQRLEFTVTAEYGLQVIAGYTQSAYSAQQAGTQLAIISTMTAYPTAAELQRQAVALRNAELTAQAGEPDRIRNLTAAEQYAKWADEREIAAICLKGILFFLGATLIIRLIVGMLYKWTLIEQAQKTTPAPPVVDLNAAEEKTPMAFVPVGNNPNEVRRVRTVIPCTLDQLLIIADGITARRMTFGINSWEGTDVHSIMAGKDFRLWAAGERLVAHIPNKGTNEVSITAAGEQFFLDTHETGQPPYPYTCLPTPPTGEDAPNTPPTAS